MVERRSRIEKVLSSLSGTKKMEIERASIELNLSQRLLDEDSPSLSLSKREDALRMTPPRADSPLSPLF